VSAEEPQQPSEEELRAALEEQMKRIRVDDVLLQTAVTLVNLAGRRLGLAVQPGEDASEERDLAQAKQAIDAVRALLPLCPEDQVAPIKDALSQLQMAYARESGGEAPAPDGGETPDQGAADPSAGAGEEKAGGDPASEAERAKARSKLWTPPGA
jgi:hypothetical protein